MAKALRDYANRTIPVTEPLNNRQVANNGGGFSFAVSDKVRLERFLILGTDSGTYYVGEMDLTKQNVNFIIDLIKRDEDLVRNTAVEISKAGRAYRNDAAVFVMALLLVHGRNKALTVAAIPDVVRTATHVYDLAGFISAFGGWGRAKRDAVNAWFASKSADELAYQAVKYRQRNGWTLRDLMRLSHPKGVDKNVGHFILKGDVIYEAPDLLHSFKVMQTAQSVEHVLRVLDNNKNLPWETIPTQFLNDPKVWKKLFENGQLKGQALIRQITRMAKLGMFDDMGFARKIADAMRDEEMIRRTRLHPMQFLNGYVVYTQGQIPRGSGNGYWGGISRQKSWNTSGIIQDGLDDGFGLSFGNIEPSNKNIMISVDVSGSMSWCAAGTSNFTCAQAAGAMALVTARVEPQYVVNGFAGDLVNLGLTARDSIESAFAKVQRNNFGSTNPSAPLKKAIRDRIPVDTFVIITDNEVNSGTHVHRELVEYRRKTGINARMVVMGMAANNFTIADPLDSGMLDVVGFDSNTSKVVSDFSARRI